MTNKIVLIDHTNTIDALQLSVVAKALARQVNEHFGVPAPHGYGTSVDVRVGTAPSKDEWVLGLFTKPDQPGALGYHDRTSSGLPLMKVFPLLCAQDHTSWSSCASHELLETLADPETCRAVQDKKGKFWALEVCDGVEQDSYLIDGVQVSNFALPCYFEPPTGKTKYDYMGLCTKPMELRPGGYNQFFDPTKGWQMVQADKVSQYRQTVGITRRSARKV